MGVTTGMAILWSFYGILQMFGFGSTGIVTGSWAANEEKWIMEHNNGIIPKDSWFAGTVHSVEISRFLYHSDFR